MKPPTTVLCHALSDISRKQALGPNVQSIQVTTDITVTYEDASTGPSGLSRSTSGLSERTAAWYMRISTYGEELGECDSTH